MTKHPSDKSQERTTGTGAADEAAADDKEKPSTDRPAAGPHAKPQLTNPESTPGAGLLPDPDDPAETADSESS